MQQIDGIIQGNTIHVEQDLQQYEGKTVTVIVHDEVSSASAAKKRQIGSMSGDFVSIAKDFDTCKDRVHPLVLSSVFHYEFVFIHPFSDGNGRMARLWQTALLAEWKPIFQYLPIESQIHQYQEKYYEAIAACHAAGNSDAFIEFMLDKIDLTLDWALQQAAEKDSYLSESVQTLLNVMEYDVPYSAAALMERLQLKSRDSFRKHFLNPALEKGLIVMGVPDKPTSRNQTYIRK